METAFIAVPKKRDTWESPRATQKAEGKTWPGGFLDFPAGSLSRTSWNGARRLWELGTVLDYCFLVLGG